MSACIRCGYNQNEQGAASCSACGAGLGLVDVNAPPTIASVPSAPSFEAPAVSPGLSAPPAAPPPAPPSSGRTNPLAIASLVLALFGFGIGQVGGIVLGLIARKQIKENGGSGEGLALAGIIISAVVLAIFVIAKL